MLSKDPDQRLSEWKSLRESVDNSQDPLSIVAQFWEDVSLIPYNHKIDQYNPKSWPTPWEIIVDNKYDDFTVAMMMGLTLKLTGKFANSNIDIKTMVDENRTRLYNLVYVDEEMVLNYDRNRVVKAQDIPNSFLLENQVGISRPR